MHSFIHQMILRNVINAALQRTSVYTDSIDGSTKLKFRESAKNCLLEFGEQYDRNNTSTSIWCEGIQDLSVKLTNEYKDYLNREKVCIGISQKMISLYLKYRWLLGETNKRPFFAVVDRGIMKQAKVDNPPNWTQLDDIEEYMRVVYKIEEYSIEMGYIDGAHWEAENWNNENKGI